MPKFVLYLTQGFGGEEVEIRIDGERVYQQETRTQLLVGLAGEVEVELEPGTHQVQVESTAAPALNLPVEMGSEPLYGLLEMAGGQILFAVDEEPPGFL